MILTNAGILSRLGVQSPSWNRTLALLKNRAVEFGTHETASFEKYDTRKDVYINYASLLGTRTSPNPDFRIL